MRQNWPMISYYLKVNPLIHRNLAFDSFFYKFHHKLQETL